MFGGRFFSSRPRTGRTQKQKAPDRKSLGSLPNLTQASPGILQPNRTAIFSSRPRIGRTQKQKAPDGKSSSPVPNLTQAGPEILQPNPSAFFSSRLRTGRTTFVIKNKRRPTWTRSKQKVTRDKPESDGNRTDRNQQQTETEPM